MRTEVNTQITYICQNAIVINVWISLLRTEHWNFTATFKREEGLEKGYFDRI